MKVLCRMINVHKTLVSASGLGEGGLNGSALSWTVLGLS
jgi:hypothetical protein